jgi:peptide/nickel transport system ATP-binding protein
MRVCAEKDPIEVHLDRGQKDAESGDATPQRVLCWLHGPEGEIPPGGKEPLDREEIAVAEEA